MINSIIAMLALSVVLCAAFSFCEMNTLLINMVAMTIAITTLLGCLIILFSDVDTVASDYLWALGIEASVSCFIQGKSGANLTTHRILALLTGVVTIVCLLKATKCF